VEADEGVISKLDKAREAFDLRQYLGQFFALIPTPKPQQIHFDCPRCEDDRGRFYVWAGPPVRRVHRGENGRKVFWCHNCSWAPNLEEFIALVEGVSLRDAMVLLRESDQTSLEEDVEGLSEIRRPDDADSPFEVVEHPEVQWPGASASLDSVDPRMGYYRSFVVGQRRFSLARAKQFGVRGCWHGRYQGRVLLPVHEDGRLVAWAARDATGTRKKKVLNGPDCVLHTDRCGCKEPTGVTTSEMLFNGDAVKRALRRFGGDDVRVRIVEGGFDAMRADREEVGQPAVAPLGTHLSAYLIELLVQAGVQKVVLMWDADTWEPVRMGDGSTRPPKVMKTIQRLNERFDTRVVRLPDGTDPDDHTPMRLDGFVKCSFKGGGYDLFEAEMLRGLE